MRISFVVLTIVGLGLAVPAIPTTIHVPGDQPTIQAGIDAALNGDTVLVADGTYTGTGNRDIDFLGKAITVRSENGAESCIVDCEQAGRGFIFQSGENQDSILQGFTIENGRNQFKGGGIYVYDSSPTLRENRLQGNVAERIHGQERGLGGGIYLEGSSARILENTFHDNETEDHLGQENYGYGAGLYATGCSLDISDNTFSGNRAYKGGGFYCVLGDSTIITGNLVSDNIGSAIATYDDNSTITGNQIVGNHGPFGGLSAGGTNSVASGNTIADNEPWGILAHDNITISSNLISGNLGGGGIYCDDDNPTITGNIITDNESGNYGGGIHLFRADPIITGNVIIGNRARRGGGGIHVEVGEPLIADNLIAANTAYGTSAGGGGISCFREANATLLNNLITGNWAGHDGGGIAVRYHSSPTIANCTITGNRATNRGGAVACYLDSHPQVSNSILWANNSRNGPQIYIGDTGSDPSTLTIEWSDLEGSWADVHVAADCQLNWGKGMIEATPLFASGPDGARYLCQHVAGQTVTSPCVDAGDPAAAMVVGSTRTDGAPDTGVVDLGYHSQGLSPWLHPHVASGLGPGPENPSRIRLFPPENDASRAYAFEPYRMDHSGVNLGCADLDGDTLDELLTGPGPGESFSAHVRGFAVDGTPLPGLDFFAYGTHQFGVNVTAGDLDADGFAEIITGPGPGAVFGPHVRGWDYDNSGLVSAMPGVSFFAYGTPKWGVNVASGDIDGDGYDEIVTGAGPGPIYGAHVRGWDVDGGASASIPQVSFFAYNTARMGVRVSCGDIDGDGMDEIITAPGPSNHFGAHIRGWNYDGSMLGELPGVNFLAWPAIEYRFGASVHAGADLDGDGRNEIVVGPGPDPTAISEVKTFALEGGTTVLRFSLQAFPDNWTYGASVAAGRF